MEKNGQNLFAYQEKLRNMAEHVCLLDRKIPIEHQLEYFAARFAIRIGQFFFRRE